MKIPSDLEPLYALIRASEGLRLRAYQDPGGVWTIGYGSTGKGIGPGLVWTQEEAERRMRVDAGLALFWVLRAFPGVNANQAMALADFTYNLGVDRVEKSTLRKRILSQDFAGAAEEFKRWVYDNGVKLPGLEKRRAAEKALFLK